MATPTPPDSEVPSSDPAATVLQREYERARVSKPQEALFRFLQVVVYGLPLLIAAYVVARSLPEESFAVSAFWIGNLIRPLLVLLVLLLVANLPLMLKAWRQARLVRRVKALELAEGLWRPRRRARRRWLLAALVAPAILLFLFVGNLVRGGLGKRSVWEAAAVVTVAFALPALLPLFDRLLDRLRSRLDYFHEVQSVRRAIAAGGSEAISGELKKRTAVIDTTRILQRRARVIRRAEGRRSSGFAILRRPEVEAASHRLEPAERLRVEETIENLSIRPQPEAAVAVAPDRWSLGVPDTGLVLVYSVDEPRRLIEILSLEAAGHPR